MRLLLITTVLMNFVDSCVKTKSPDDLKPMCQTQCLNPYSCAGNPAPGGNCETAASVGADVSTTDGMSCWTLFRCPMNFLGNEGYQTWIKKNGVWSAVPFTNGEGVFMYCVGGKWEYGTDIIENIACAS